MQDILYDTIEFKLKREKAGEIEAQLECFGWEIEREWDAKFYSDIVHVRFRRPHKVEQKDRLQLLQVRVEIAHNRQVNYERIMESRAVVFGLISGLILLALMGFGLELILKRAIIGWGIAVIAVSSVLLCVTTLLSVLIKRHDRKKYTRLMREGAAKIDECCRAAHAITGKGALYNER